MPRLLPLLFALIFLSACAATQTKHHSAAIASAHPLATKAGEEILAQGGNAFDAAVAISAALSVVEPAGSGIGGGGFWLLHRSSDGKQVMLDGRETAPLAASRDMYLDKLGNVIPRLSLDGAMAAGIPGLPAALDKLATEYGRLPLAQSLAPAIRYAKQGFTADEHMIKRLAYRKKALSGDAPAIFLTAGELPNTGANIIQNDLAWVLEQLAEHGRDGFYSGAVAEKLVAGVQAAGGIWQLNDLAEYAVLERAPVKSHYHDWQITSASLPSSGGIVLALTLNILEQFDLNALTPVQQIHLTVEAMRRAYRERAAHLGDIDYVDVPVKKLLSKAFAKELAVGIKLDSTTPSSELPATFVENNIGTDTTHFSVLDSEGNRVSATLSINLPFGSGFIPPGTGVFLNNEMDDFSIKPGSPNAYGLVGNEANAIAPGKRMLSSMTPTFIENNSDLAVLGTPGGSRIISMVLLAGLEWMNSASAENAVNKPRFHHQYLPDVIQFEFDAFSDEQIAVLQKMGHKLKPRGSYGNMHLISKQGDAVSAASDKRGIGKKKVILTAP